MCRTSFFPSKCTHGERDERGEQKNMIGCIAVDEKLRKDVLDAEAVRGMHDGSDHYVVLAKIKIKNLWEYGKMSKVQASGRMDSKEVKEVEEE